MKDTKKKNNFMAVDVQKEKIKYIEISSGKELEKICMYNYHFTFYKKLIQYCKINYISIKKKLKVENKAPIFARISVKLISFLL